MFLFGGLAVSIKDLCGLWLLWLYGVLYGVLYAPDTQHRIRQCRSIVNFSFASAEDTRNTGSSSNGLHVRLGLRAKANQQLADALGIHNSLTTTDPKVHWAFLRQVGQRLRAMDSATQWQKLYGYSEQLLEKAVDIRNATNATNVETHTAHSRHKLAALVRRVCLESVMYVLFQASGLDPDDVSTVCDEINKQWVLSKAVPAAAAEGREVREGRMEQRQDSIVQQSPQLIQALDRLLQDSPERENLSPQQALELILPSYEALWRVVLLTYVTVCHRQPCDTIATADIADIASVIGTGSPRETELRKIAKEGLRLFPSSKRIYRAQSLSSTDTSMIAANVSALHRDRDIWGPDSLEFRPSRFHDDMAAEQQHAYMPFGLPLHRCPAYDGFGERIILLLVAVLCTRLGPDKASIVYNDARLDGNKEAELPSGRYDMEDWVLALRDGMTRK
ncbi:hypothetical protein SCUCBS95973_007076 [Sporothrix curviconia]|uniref:Cytochrome P450 n=1 Tax=Sporothrix curviconia TaxID=1260050 RepID=A0ABP0CC29_9PEZI